MKFGNDKLWGYAKKAAMSQGLENKWIEIIDLYNDSGGESVNIYCVTDEGKYRILHILDSGEVLLLDNNLNPTGMEYKVVEESKKVFFFEPEPEKVKLELPEGMTYLGESELEYYT